MSEKSNEIILRQLQEKVLLKQDVFNKTKEVFDALKKKLSIIADELKSSVQKVNKDIIISYKDTDNYEAEFTIADETLVFLMHTNIFTFDSSHEIWRTKYIHQDSQRSFCGKIFIYNFLSDSFNFNRINAVGYLIARIFINKDKHYLIEGKKQFSNMYNDFSTNVLDKENLQKIIESALLYALDFDPFTPPFDNISEISIKDLLETNLQSRITTGKRLGFQFESEKKEG